MNPALRVPKNGIWKQIFEIDISANLQFPKNNIRGAVALW